MERERKNIEKSFLEILSKAESLGITRGQLANLNSLRQIANSRQTNRRLFSGIAVVCVLALILTSGICTREGLSRAWFWWENLEEKVEFCTVEMPTSVQNAFLPPFDCSLCSNLSSVERLTDIDPEVFEDRFAYSGIPVIVTDAMKNWSASEVFSFDFFKQLYPPDSRTVGGFSKRGCQFFPYKTKFRNLAEVFQMSHERAVLQAGSEPWYIGWSNCDQSIANILRKHYHRPYFLPVNSEGASLDWIFMGSPGYGAHMHIDHVGKPSWQAQIRGQKTWTLQAPPECAFACKELQVTVRPGEIIVLDTNMWYHKTVITGEDLSITIGSEFD